MTRNKFEQKIADFCRNNLSNEHGFNVSFEIYKQNYYQVVIKQGKHWKLEYTLEMPECESNEEVDAESLKTLANKMAYFALCIIEDHKAGEKSKSLGKSGKDFYKKALESQIALVKKIKNMAARAKAKQNSSIQ